MIPYFDDMADVGRRTPRGKDGKTYYVSADMGYKEWEKSFADGDKLGLQQVMPDDTMNFMDITNEWTATKGKRGSISGKQEYIVNGEGMS